VATGRIIVGASLAISMAVLASHSPALAKQRTRDAASGISAGEPRERDVNHAMLNNLLQRRADVARSADNPESKRLALEFLDRQIGKVRGRIGD
jgi:hypothetical protein